MELNKQQKENIVQISDTQRYKMCGNAVTTKVITSIIERLFSNEN